MLFRALKDGIQPPVAECLTGFGLSLASVANIAEGWPSKAANQGVARSSAQHRHDTAQRHQIDVIAKRTRLPSGRVISILSAAG